MYRFISALSVLIRTFCLPNPFETLEDTFSVTIAEVALTISPDVLNLIAEPVLHAVTFALVGLYYTRDLNNASTGSFLYLLFYCFHVGLLYLMGLFGFATWAIVLILIAYLMLHVGFNVLKEKIYYGV